MLAAADSTRPPEVTLPECEAEIARLRELAYADELTGLGNRRGFERQLEKCLAYADRYGGPVSLAVADLDGFKEVNDNHGHPIGDDVLRTIGALFRSALRGADYATRIGGDEFALILPNTSGDEAAEASERLRSRIESLLLPRSCRITASFGVAVAGRCERARQLYERADAALYAAKRRGKNRVEVAGSGHACTAEGM